MALSLKKIDLSYTALDENDRCFYWRPYNTNKEFRDTERNKIIWDFKNNPSACKKQPTLLQDKLSAIEYLANEMIEVLHDKQYIFTNYTFIPIPPSKSKLHKDYDDRLVKLLQKISEKLNIVMDIRELVIQKKDLSPSHMHGAGNRPSIRELMANYEVEKTLLQPTAKKIMIFDDVLTQGCHYKAVQKTIQSHYANHEILIFGLFIARSQVIEKSLTDTKV